MHPCPRMPPPGSPFNLPTESKWRADDTCSFCGGLNPDKVLDLLGDGSARMVPTDKNYKLYLWSRTLPNDQRKTYFYHFTDEQKTRFVEMVNDGRAQFIRDCSGFYVLPYFMADA